MAGDAPAMPLITTWASPAICGNMTQDLAIHSGRAIVFTEGNA